MRIQRFLIPTFASCLLLLAVHLPVSGQSSPLDSYHAGVKVAAEDPAKAIRLFTDALQGTDETWKQRVECLLQRADVLVKTGQMPQALGDYFEVLRLRPKHFEANKNIARLNFEMGNYAEAMRYADDAKATNPDDAVVRYLRGRIFLIESPKGGDLMAGKIIEEAFNEFTKAIELDSRFAEPYFHRGVALAIFGRMNEAISDLETVIRLRPELYQAHFEIARIRFVQEQWHGTIQSLQSCLQLKEDFHPALSMIIPALVQVDDMERTRNYLRLALKHYPADSFFRAWNSRLRAVSEDELSQKDGKPDGKDEAIPRRQAERPVSEPSLPAKQTPPPPARSELAPAPAPAKPPPQAPKKPPRPDPGTSPLEDDFPDQVWY